VTWVRICWFVTFLSACVAPEPLPEPIPKRIPLQADLLRGLFEGPALNVSIAEFRPGQGGEPSLRNAEARYMPVVLKRALMEAGGWGAIRVLPDDDPAAELQISGEIATSNGVELSLRMNVVDSTGRVWLEQTYLDYTFDHGYEEPAGDIDDPFLDIYYSIANDINKVRSELIASEVNNLIDIATLRYARSLSPETFSQFLREDDAGRLHLTSLPARDDSMIVRSERIRDSEYGFADTVDATYMLFYEEIAQTYTDWRRYSYELVLGNETLEFKTTSKRSGSWAKAEAAYDTFRESKMNEDEMRKMTKAFDSEVTPTAMELEGTVIHLTGSLQARYAEWRKILKGIYEAERAVTQ